MLENDATPSYRGYRLQALYILDRILESQPDLFYTPEGIEDLAITRDNKNIEIVQVKSYDGLVLSNLEPAKENSFFRRVNQFFEKNDILKILVVNIGLVGPELQNAWAGKNKDRDSITNKLTSYGYADNEIQRFFDRIQLVSLDENELKTKVEEKISNLLVGIDLQHSFDLLQKWLYDLSESRSSISQNDLIDRIQQVGNFLNDRSHYHTQWFTNIIPISSNVSIESDDPDLRDEFFAGASARYEHILAELDFLRPSKMESIKQGFSKENIVIIHGASGQGKSTLAFRYLHDNYPEQLRYNIKLVQDRNHALQITRALSGYAEALGTSIIVYLDVSPRDQDWTELLVQLAENPFIQVLVTVREEDFYRANVPYDLQFADVSLELFVEEAAQLYQRVKESSIDIGYLSFEETWEAFGGNGGPLLEYVYLLTQTETLRNRLKEQVKRLKIEVREKQLSPDELALLKLAAVITAYEGRLHLTKLTTQLKLPNLSTTLENYEKEYLIRVSDDQQYIEALHPVRSNILTDLLIDPGIDPWSALAEQALSLTLESDWEIFLLNAYVYRSESFNELISITKNLFPKTWQGMAGVLRCLLWIGLRIYIDKNQQSIKSAKELMGEDLFWLIMDLNFAGEFGKALDNWWETLSDDLIPKDRKEAIKNIRKEQTPKDEVFDLATKWLSSQNSPAEQPSSLQDWQNASELLYWSSRFNLADQVGEWILDDSIIQSINVIDLQNFSNILFALYINTSSRYEEILKIIKKDLILRLAKEYRIFVLEELENTLILHYLTYPEEGQNSIIEENSTNRVHRETIARIEIVRKLFPDFEKYGSRGYGHNIPGLEILSDESIKTGIPSRNFPPQWPIKINGISSGLIKYEMRLDTWEEYIEILLQTRDLTSGNLELLLKNINRYFQRDKVKNFLEMPPFSTNDWDRGSKMISDLPILPKASTDPWGIGQPESDSSRTERQENSANVKITSAQTDGNQLTKARSSILQRKYHTYLKAEREYFSRLRAFYDQAIHVSILNIRCGKETEGSPQKQAIIDELETNGVVLRNKFFSKINIWEAYCNVKSYQLEFRRLLSEKIEAKRLVNLEEQERDVLEKILWSWFTFVDNPRTSLARPVKKISQRIYNQIDSITNNISNTLSAPKFAFGSTRILKTDLDWENQSALWIQLDVSSPLEINIKIEELIYSLEEILGVSQYGDLLYSLAQSHLKYIVIVPTIQSKSIDRLVYPLATASTLMQKNKIEEKPYLFVPREITPEILADLGIEVWQLEYLKDLDDFNKAFNSLLLQLNLLAELGEMPKCPEESESELEDYMKLRSAEVAEALQLFMDSKTIIAEYLEQIPEDIINTNDLLSEIVKRLPLLDEIVLPKDGVLNIFEDQFNEYIQNLQDTQPQIVGIRLVILNDLLKEEYVNQINS